MICYTPADPPTHAADLFLGGSCTPDHVWRQDLLAALHAADLVIYSPERSDFPGESLADPAYRAQVDWERLALDHSRAAVFWLDPAKPTSYASRIEIGVVLGRDRPCVIGVDPAFPGATYLRQYVRPPATLVLTYDEFLDATLALAHSLVVRPRLSPLRDG